MLRIIRNEEDIKSQIISMSEMKPYQVARIVSCDSAFSTAYIGKIVMRTASTALKEVMSLDDGEGAGGCCWGEDVFEHYKVELLREPIIVRIWNKF